MAYILEKIGNTYNLPKKYFTCDAKSDLDGISLVDVPIGSEAYCILEEESYILDSNKQWHKKKIGEDLTGQVQADLSQTDSTKADYVKGVLRTEHLPKGYPYKEIGTILDGTFEFADMDGIYGCIFVDEDFTYVNGKSYTIIWDGVTYQCTATIFESSPDDNQLVLGNLGIMGMTDTGEPFLFLDQGNGQKAIGTNNTAATHTITVSGEVACPIAFEYLPEGYPHKEQSKTVFFKWNGYIGDKENIDVSDIIGREAYYVKVSDTVLQKEVFVGAVITDNSGESITVSSEDLIDTTGGYIVDSEDIIMVSDKDIFNFSGIKFPSNGLWTIKVIENSGKFYCAAVIRTTKIIYPMSEEFLPDKYITETELASKGYLTSIPNEYVTETELASKGYLTAIPNEYVTSLGNKQDKLTFDTKPTSGSTNPVTSGGIKSYVDAAQVQSDWSINDKSNSAYIKNRPFYDATSYTSIYVSSSKLPEATTLNEDTGLYYGTTNYNYPSLEVGQKYKFTYFNGNSNETFILTASSYKLSSGYTYVEVLGNAQLGADYGLIDASYAQRPVSDTGEPFCFIVYPTSMNAIVARNKNGKLSSFYKVNEELVQLDVKYLPDHTHDFSELTITDLEAAKTALTIENGMILKNLQAVMPSKADWYSITYGNDKFVSVTSRNIAAYSKNGITWTVTTMPSSANWKSVTYGNDKFVAVAYESTKAAYSEDGINWTSATLPSSAKWCSVAYGNGKFVAMAYNSNVAAYSEDGITWTAITMPSAVNWRSVTYGNSKFVAVADEQTTAYSEDGITWTVITLPSFAVWRSVTYGNGKFVAVAQGMNAAYSEDGITWTGTTLPSFAWISVTYGNGKFVAVADGQTTAYSEDGITWTVITIRNYAHWESIAYGNDKFVAVASNSTDTAFSFDGINWQTELNMITQNNSNVTENVRSAIGIPSYSITNNGQFLRVINGIPTWTEFLPTLTSPNGTKYQLTVSDDGTLSAVAQS